MSSPTTVKPEAMVYASYYERYVALVPAGDIIATLDHQCADTLMLLRSLSESQANARYAPGKWSVKELVGHMIDTERIFGYRALRFARNDQTALPGFEQDGYIENAEFDSYQLHELAAEFEAVRRSHVSFFRHLPGAAWERRGTASENEVSVRALAHIMAGHELHHVGILRTKYLTA